VIESLRNRAGLAPGPLENSATTPSKMTPAERANEIEAAERTRRWNKAAAEAREARQRAKRQARLAEEDY
ncbi:MAG TPA: hypothetical protein VN711_02425, partial [Candidatus Saccharimonadales bacterium]|nr:hypothetical protein [Candidatus Saccharimonadales bacterium]